MKTEVYPQQEHLESDDVEPAATCCEEMMGGMKPMEMCPMAGMCKGMTGKKGMGSSWLLLLPGVLLVARGLLVILVPNILVWLVGVTSIFLGVMFFFIANGIRKFAAGMGKHSD